MQEVQLRWQQHAVQDLEDAHAFLAEESPEAARRLAQLVLEATERLQAFPELGNLAKDLSPADRYRSLVVGTFRLIYRLEEM